MGLHFFLEKAFQSNESVCAPMGKILKSEKEYCNPGCVVSMISPR